jgi:hypothetical protein
LKGGRGFTTDERGKTEERGHFFAISPASDFVHSDEPFFIFPSLSPLLFPLFVVSVGYHAGFGGAQNDDDDQGKRGRGGKCEIRNPPSS